jgi:DNA-binding SARP family transcriptional activator
MTVVSSLVGRSTDASHCRLELLQHFRLYSDGQMMRLGQPAEHLIAFLAVDERSHTRDHVAGCLWPDSTQSRAASSLRRVLSLIQPIAPELIVREGHRLSLSEEVLVDIRLQRSLIDTIISGERAAVDRVELGLLRRDLLPDWDDLWLTPLREELRQLRLLSLEALAVAQLDLERPHAALAVALFAALDEPLRESAHRLVVEAHLALGNRAAAARHYNDYRRSLWTELRLRPGLRMESLVRPFLSDGYTAS